MALTLALAAPAHAAPAPLSADTSRVDVASPYGSGTFGRWTVDRFGLPAYRYDIDEQTAPQALQAETNSRDAWHQVGNDHIVADAYNHGYVQLWSQDRDYQWVNRYQEQTKHFGGGYGYLSVGGQTISTLYPDRPAGAQVERDFGTGYARSRMQAAGLDVEQVLYAPFGDDPVLLHDVTIRNTTSASLRPSWFEYWDVNPQSQSTKENHGLAPPAFDSASRTLSAAQLPDPLDRDPLSIYAAALQGPVSGYDTNLQTFFGTGDRAAPAEVAADTTTNSTAPPAAPGAPGVTAFVFRAPVSLAPGQSVTLRYAYGAAHATAIPGIVSRYRGQSDPFGASERAWADWLPQASFGSGREWLSRELQWDAYQVRSGATWEDCRGAHILSQGGYYQYDSGFQGAFRDPLQHMLPMIYTDPGLARDVLRYSASEQPASGFIPYAMGPYCTREDLGTSNDLDLWLLLGASEYALATRDLGFLDQRVPYADGGSGTLWDHLKLAYHHQEETIGHGPHGGYLAGVTGDWSDFATEFLQMTESTLPVAQLAYIYPRLALVADDRGDQGFAQELRATAATLDGTLRNEWTGPGWISRGYSAARQIGAGIIFGEPQPWALLSGVLSQSQSTTLVANIRRFLTGVGAPAELHGPSKIGSALVPSPNDPDVTEKEIPPIGSDGYDAGWPGGEWFAVNGWLTWALGTLDGFVPHAVDDAWDEFLRNTLAAHATAFPDHWDGLISVDDLCHSYYSSEPSKCGTGLSTTYNTQILHQPAWSLFDAVKLAGMEPTRDGYRIAPHVPTGNFSLRLPGAGVERTASGMRGYLRPEAGGRIVLHVVLPAGVTRVSTWVDGRRVAHTIAGGEVTFAASAPAHAATDWAVTW